MVGYLVSNWAALTVNSRGSPMAVMRVDAKVGHWAELTDWRLAVPLERHWAGSTELLRVAWKADSWVEPMDYYLAGMLDSRTAVQTV